MNTNCKQYFLPMAVALLLILTTLTGCSLGMAESTRLRDLEFTVITDDLLPDELKTLIDERKTGEFKMTYADKDCLYICVGYGEQTTGGYSIAVDDLYLAEDAIYIYTTLIGPAAGEKPVSTPSYPYLVVKTELLDKPVVFE